MKKIISSFIAITLLLIQIPVFAISGAGTEANPYIISSASDIASIHNDLDGYYRLAGNINMNGVSFTPIGNESEGAFAGTIDGNGYTISNLNINLPEKKYVGFIGYLEGTVKNLTLTNITANGYRYVGGVAGYAAEGSAISYCTTSGNIGGEFQIVDINIGGIVGSNYGQINHCDSSSNISHSKTSSPYYTGGIAGYNNSEITDSTFTGEISGYNNVGGIVGYNADGLILHCINEGDVTANCYVGGITGYNNGTLTIDNCINRGTITGNSWVGGILGANIGKVIIKNNVNGGTVKATGNSSLVGGILGHTGSSSNNTIDNCANTGTVTGSYSYVGGILGNNEGYTAITACNNSGSITGNLYVGGILGYSSSIIRIYSSNSSGSITGRDYVGGIMGMGYECYNCSNSGAVNATGGNACASGIAYSGGSYNCVNTGQITAKNVTNLGSSVYNITLSDYTVQNGASVMMPIELYGYDKELQWLSSDNSVATVNSSGVVTGKKVGITTITAITELGISTSATLTVYSAATGILLNKSAITLQKGFTEKLYATVLPSDSTDTVTWASMDEDIVTVSSDGVVTAVGTGNTSISAKTSNGKIAYCAVSVTEPSISVASVTLDKTSLTMAPEDVAQLNATVLPANATNKTLTWTSSDESVAIVSGTGVVTAKSSGIAIIKATSANGMYHECVVKVVSASGPSIILSDANIVLGEQAIVKANIVQNPGISAYKFKIDYDDTVLEPGEITANTEFGGTLTTNLDDENRDELNILWYNDNNVETNGELFTIAFNLKDTPFDNSTTVSLEYDTKDICNESGENIALFIDSAEVTVTEPIPGDVYEDGEVTVYDLTLLSRYITGLETFTPRQMDEGDVNNDGEVDIKDVVKLAQYLVGWSGVVLMSVDDTEKTADIKLGTAAVNDENEAYIPISIENNSGIAGFRFNIEYDHDAVEILDIIPNTDILPQNLQSNLGQEDENGLLVTWYQEGNTTANGELFKLKVKYTGDTASEISIKQADNNMCDQALANVIGTYQNGYVLGSKCVVAENIESNNDTLTIYSDASLKNQSAVAIIGLYKTDGTLVKCLSENISLSGGKQVIPFDIAGIDYDYTKIFLWDGLDSMKPLI